MKLRLGVAVFLLFTAFILSSCAPQQSTGQFPDRISNLERVSTVFSANVTGLSGSDKQYEIRLFTDSGSMDRFWQGVLDPFTQTLGVSTKPTDLDFNTYDYLVVVSKPKSKAIKFQIQSASQDPDGNLHIALTETRPDIHTADAVREIQMYRILKTFHVKDVELAKIDTVNPNATH
ncbi:hypothetical protein [Effusibacillus dendaii]|uniref:Uncharacterized protein n=1 Tax=Effusibacillus dendaii TaxID=2743772 RepID=A0A7I8DD92_9BACL|nr:hypothetical protein [Effusibacillus dendaii]BCJ85861.1 hypothetical protein skT53_08460 [Effusibacillus dendaii]